LHAINARASSSMISTLDKTPSCPAVMSAAWLRSEGRITERSDGCERRSKTHASYDALRVPTVC
jgi:hypothetical protein